MTSTSRSCVSYAMAPGWPLTSVRRMRTPGSHVTGLVDFDQPLCVLMVGVLPHVMDEEDPAGIVAAFRDRVAPGSHLVLSHAMAESDPSTACSRRPWSRSRP